MHWLEEWRMNYRHRNGTTGISREEFAAMVRKRGVGCSEVLIAILERHEKGITHPGIAEKIIDVVGGTQEQYDSIVHEIHRGKRPMKKRRRRQEPEREKMLKPQPLSFGTIPPNARMVVKLDAYGNELERYASINEAAVDIQCSAASVHKRCHRRIANEIEFNNYGCTFRFADEWDSMNPQQRADDMRSAEKQNKEDKCKE